MDRFLALRFLNRGAQLILLLALCAWVSRAQGADPPAPDSGEIRLGLSAALTGPTQWMGRSVRSGIEACLAEVNAQGGLHGRSVRLIALDDGYEPDQARKNVSRLIDEWEVLALVGNVGTPTAKATVPIAIEERVLLFGAVTGAQLLRAPPERYVINFRASYEQETQEMISGLLGMGIRPFEIAFFSQDDDYGRSGVAAVISALEGAGYPHGKQLAHGKYSRNQLDVSDGILAVLDAEVPPKAIIMVGAYAPCAKFISIVRRVLPDCLYLSLSFVDADALSDALGPSAKGVIVTQVVPDHRSALPICERYRNALAATEDKRPGAVSLEGFMIGSMIVEGVRRAGPGVTRESLIDVLESDAELDIGLGEPLRFDKSARQWSPHVWPIEIQDGEQRAVDWSRLRAAD